MSPKVEIANTESELHNFNYNRVASFILHSSPLLFSSLSGNYLAFRRGGKEGEGEEKKICKAKQFGDKTG